MSVFGTLFIFIFHEPDRGHSGFRVAHHVSSGSGRARSQRIFLLPLIILQSSQVSAALRRTDLVARADHDSKNL